MHCNYYYFHCMQPALPGSLICFTTNASMVHVVEKTDVLAGNGDFGSRLRTPSNAGDVQPPKVPSSSSGTPKSADGSAAEGASPLAPALVSPRPPAEGSFCAPEAIKRISKEATGTVKVRTTATLPFY